MTLRFISVLKAGRPPRGKEDLPVHRVADGATPKVEVTLLRAFDEFGKQAVTDRVIQDLIRHGALSQLDLHIPWGELRKLITTQTGAELYYTLAKAADAASASTAAALRQALGITPTLTFDGSNPRLQKWMQQNTARLVKEVTEESRAAIQAVIARAQLTDMSPLEVQQAIRRSLTLTTQQAVAAQAVYERAVNQGVDHGEALDEASQYAERALNYRAERIARSETMVAASQGQQEGWLQAADDGLYDKRKARVGWVVTYDDRTCPTCAPMDGQTRTVDGYWEVTIRNARGAAIGRKRVTNPNEVHPMCRCAQKLILEDSGD